MTTTELADFRLSLRQHLADGDLPAVLAELKKSLPEQSAKWNTVCLTETRLNQLSKDNLRGILSREAAELSHNQIAANLLDLLNGLEEADFSPATAASASKAQQQGRILYRVPHTMQVEEEHRCVVRLAFDEASILQGIEMTEHTVLKPIRVSEIMEVELIDPNEAPAFRIRSIIAAEQLIVQDEHTEWLFWVKPLRTGELPLMLKVAVKEMVGDRERRRDIVLEELIRVVAEPSADTEELGFQNAGYTVSYSMAPVKPVASSSNYRRPLMALAVFVAAVGIWAAVRTVWFAPVPIPARPDPVLQKDSADWQQALLLGADSNFQFYLLQHPEGVFKALAQAKLDSLLKIQPPLDNPAAIGKPKLVTPKTTEVDNRKSGFTMVEVKGGTYTVGKGGSRKCEQQAKVRNFKIGKYEVTQTDWESVMGVNPSDNKGCGECPVEKVSWEEVQVFLQRASVNGKRYRLPLEVEWEYAARGGQADQGFKYAGSDKPTQVAQFSGGPRQSSVVGSKKENALGIFDMSGNVQEWCEDIWKSCDGKKYKKNERVVRGGSWAHGIGRLPVYERQSANQSKGDYATGFRMVQD